MNTILKFILIFLLILFKTTIASDLIENDLTLNQDKNEINYELNIEEEVLSLIKPQISINTQYKIDLSLLKERLNILYPNNEYKITWETKNKPIIEDSIFLETFKEKGEIEIKLNIHERYYSQNEEGGEEEIEKIIYNKTINILVYEKSLPIIFGQSVNKTELDNYINFSRKDGIFVYKIGPIDRNEMELSNMMNYIEKYENLGGLKSDYISIWGDRDFIFDILGKINREIILDENIQKKYNIVAMSNYNINLIQSYLKNFLSNKDWINKMIIIDESAKYNILRQNLIENLEKELIENKFDYVDVNIEKKYIGNLMFISKFINNLSNIGFGVNNIYIFLIIPLILTFISFFKHFIGLSPIGLVIPLFITLLFFKLGIILTFVLLGLYLLINLAISLLIDKYKLLYAPKISFIISINIIIFILFLNIAYDLNTIPLNLTDIIYFVVFIIITERFINIIISKDLNEYKEPFLNTIIISLFCYLILNFNYIKIFILAYPELIITLIPINFLIGRFTGLRVTEYFRFKEVIKNIEE